MNSSQPSSTSIEAINAVLLEHNPFSQPPFVNANNVWGKSFPDVESLNSHASDAVFKALEEIRKGQCNAVSVLITAQDGTGKTHIISRIRHRLQAQGGAFFIFANKFNNLNNVKQGFQQLLADSLSNIGSQGVRQWQELATSMANDVFRAANPNAKLWEPKDLVKKIDQSNEQSVTAWVTKLTTQFCRIKTVQDPDIIRGIFWTLSENQVLDASKWLAGKELPQFKSNELRLPTQNESFDAVLQILDVISEYNELVICFDELDVADINDGGLYKAQLIASLVKELIENLRRGVILTVMMPGIWTEKVSGAMPRSVSTKLMTYSDSPLELKYLDGDSTIELVSFFLKEYYDARDLVPPHSIYPFDEVRLREIGQEKPTMREVLQWCRTNCTPVSEIPTVDKLVHEPAQDDSLAQVEMAFTHELSEDIKLCIEDNYLLADALFFGFQNLVNQSVDKFVIQEVTTGVKKRGKKDDYLNFKVIGADNGAEFRIGVAVLQYEGGRAFGAGLKRLQDKAGFDITRGCLVRSKDRPINKHFRTTHLEPLINQGGEFVELNEKEIKPLLALRAVWKKRESDYKVTEEEILNFIAEKGSQYWLGIHNPLLQEILSDPSYQIPEDIADEPEPPKNLDHSNDSDESNLFDDLDSSSDSDSADVLDDLLIQV
ncbi:MAG: AAA family ATPase [Plectolyngbya sp. WJT66-NPBG17]|jgi:hypothetical protein|nr:AAA family ATPase [Plectolyngbya sp. WJT66-NPBG17]MBW4526017.1 AAA family ATPase [Phormidium tanganyikae FI6-MK23]